MLQITKQFRQVGVTAMSHFAQRLPIDELHRDEVHAVALTDLVNVRNVGVIERRGGGGLLLEAAHSISIGSKVGRQYFQRDFAVQASILSQINLTHPAYADLRADFITAEFCVGL